MSTSAKFGEVPPGDEEGIGGLGGGGVDGVGNDSRCEILSLAGGGGGGGGGENEGEFLSGITGASVRSRDIPLCPFCAR